VQQKAVPKGLKMEVEVPKPSTKELSHFELQHLRRVEAIETQRQEYTLQVTLTFALNSTELNGRLLQLGGQRPNSSIQHRISTNNTKTACDS